MDKKETEARKRMYELLMQAQECVSRLDRNGFDYYSDRATDIASELEGLYVIGEHLSKKGSHQLSRLLNSYISSLTHRLDISEDEKKVEENLLEAKRAAASGDAEQVYLSMQKAKFYRPLLKHEQDGIDRIAEESKALFGSRGKEYAPALNSVAN